MRWLLLLIPLLSACEVYDKPRRPVGENFRARTLDGEVVDASTLRGRPWVVNVWVPG